MSNIEESRKTPTKGILQKSHEYEAHITPEHKLKWDESKLKATEKQKEQVLMKVNEPNTPYIRYDPATDQVTNWKEIPESVRKSAIEEPDEFSLNDDYDEVTPKVISLETNNGPKDEWEKADEEEQLEKRKEALKRHEEFEKKRAQHYSHNGDVLHG